MCVYTHTHTTTQYILSKKKKKNTTQDINGKIQIGNTILSKFYFPYHLFSAMEVHSPLHNSH